jgi:hypothetical protein
MGEQTLNIAGPRESEYPGACDLRLTILIKALAFQSRPNRPIEKTMVSWWRNELQNDAAVRWPTIAPL